LACWHAHRLGFVKLRVAESRQTFQLIQRSLRNPCFSDKQQICFNNFNIPWEIAFQQFELACFPRLLALLFIYSQHSELAAPAQF